MDHPPPKALHSDEQKRLLDVLTAATGIEAGRDRMLIELLLGTILPGRNRIGIAVLDLDSGQLIYGRNADLQLNIASNVKLFTTAAALTLLLPA